jgi:hypothetical protein
MQHGGGGGEEGAQDGGLQEGGGEEGGGEERSGEEVSTHLSIGIMNRHGDRELMGTKELMER